MAVDGKVLRVLSNPGAEPKLHHLLVAEILGAYRQRNELALVGVLGLALRREHGVA
jgi:hypothetical protein